jgi:hypothetical protein
MLFQSQRIHFGKVDPLGDGLGDDIAQERLEPEAITLEEGIDEGQLTEFWQSVENDIEKDPEWFHFTEE